jgi:hypothetical protein
MAGRRGRGLMMLFTRDGHVAGRLGDATGRCRWRFSSSALGNQKKKKTERGTSDDAWGRSEVRTVGRCPSPRSEDFRLFSVFKAGFYCLCIYIFIFHGGLKLAMAMAM